MFGDVGRGDERQGTHGDVRSGTGGSGKWGHRIRGPPCYIAEKRKKVTINSSKKLLFSTKQHKNRLFS